MSVNQISDIDRIAYNNEFKMDYERTQSLLKKCVRSDGLQQAGTVKWDVVDPSEEAQQRTRDGDIPIAQLGLGQVTGTPQEDFGGKYKIDAWDAFRTNPNVRSVQMMKASAAVHRKKDAIIIRELDTATQTINSGSAVDFTDYGVILDWIKTLENNDVPTDDGKVWGVVTPTALRGMMKIAQFTSKDYVEVRKMENGLPSQGYYRWLGVNWFSHTGLTGKGTATATCHLFHESAVGHQDVGEPDYHVYYYEPQHRWENYAVAWHCAKLCLPRGVVKATCNDTTTYAA
jgi:hypothetical protein